MVRSGLWLLYHLRVSSTMRAHVHGKHVLCFRWTSLDDVIYLLHQCHTG